MAMVPMIGLLFIGVGLGVLLSYLPFLFSLFYLCCTCLYLMFICVYFTVEVCDYRLAVFDAVQTPEYEDVSTEFLIEDVDSSFDSDGGDEGDHFSDMSDDEILSICAEDDEGGSDSDDERRLCDEYCVDHGTSDPDELNNVDVEYSPDDDCEVEASLSPVGG